MVGIHPMVLVQVYHNMVDKVDTASPGSRVDSTMQEIRIGGMMDGGPEVEIATSGDGHEMLVEYNV